MENSLMLPGDKLPSSAFAGISVKLGPGLQQSRGSNPNDHLSVTVVNPGTLRHATKGNKWWIDRRANRVSGLSL
jgi:hypothetical protein